MGDVTRILASIESGDAHAAEQLLPLVYDELRKLARAKLRHEQPASKPTGLCLKSVTREGGWS
jgi:ECF sigma factor